MNDRLIFVVRPAWAITWRCKSAAEVGCYQPLAKSKGPTVRWDLEETGGKTPT